jgi:hypothetical protein
MWEKCKTVTMAGPMARGMITRHLAEECNAELCTSASIVKCYRNTFDISKTLIYDNHAPLTSSIAWDMDRAINDLKQAKK